MIQLILDLIQTAQISNFEDFNETFRYASDLYKFAKRLIGQIQLHKNPSDRKPRGRHRKGHGRRIR